MNASDLRERIARLAGVETRYEDAWGKPHTLNSKDIDTLLAVLGVTAVDQHTFDQLEARAWQRLVEPVTVLKQTAPAEIPIVLPQARRAMSVAWHLQEERGQTHQGAAKSGALPVVAVTRHNGCRVRRHLLQLPAALPLGYHSLRITTSSLEAAYAEGEACVIIVPAECFLPPALAAGGRLWGFAVQLYGLRSAHNWGIGDFGDLLRLVEAAAALGAGAIGINPLHAGFLATPERASPYEPSSRRLLNVLYIDVHAAADFAECPVAQARVAKPAFQKRLQALRAAPLVDYPGVARCKLEVLELLYGSFVENHLTARESDRLSARGQAFRDFQQARDPSLRAYAIFETLAERFNADGTPEHWPAWPEAYRDVNSIEVQEFARQAETRVEFYAYLQWLAHVQLEQVNKRCRALALPIGLYLDLAIGVARDGVDVWGDRPAFVTGAAVGAPPDAWNLLGQNWGLPPLHPERLREHAYAPLVDVLRTNMRYAGALRIDHVLALLRLYWIPRGAAPDAGGYVRYPLADLLGILALESQRNGCLVVGEDLGTVPNDLRARLQGAGVLSYRLLYFEQDEDGRPLAPDMYPRLALAGITTHDLPTLPGYWAGHDLELRRRLKLFPSARHEADAYAEHERDRAALLEALRRQGLWPESGGDLPRFDQALMEAAYVFLARSPSMILMVQFEDILGLLDQPNLPGTVTEHPNWRRKLPAQLDDVLRDPRVVALARRLSAIRCIAPNEGGEA